MKAIWAEDSAGGIGGSGSLLWSLPEDLKSFRELTSGGTVVMGRKTWESLPFRPLLNRTNVVLSRTVVPSQLSGAVLAGTVEEVVKSYPNAWVIGGAEIYEAFMPHISSIHRTVVDAVFSEADSFAPAEWEGRFQLRSVSPQSDKRSGLGFRFEVWGLTS